MTALVIVAASGFVLAAAFAFGHGRDLFGAIKARRAEQRAICERDQAKRDWCVIRDDNEELARRLSDAERKRAEALACIAQKNTALEEAEATRIRQIEDCARDMTRMESEMIALRLQVEHERERVAKIKAHTAAA